MSDQIYKETIFTLLQKIEEADAIIVGGGSGMSASAGYVWYRTDENFLNIFGPFAKKYGIDNIFNGFYHRYSTAEERWAYIATLINFVVNAKIGQPYLDLFQLIKDKSYFVLTTNQDTQFSKVFPEEKTCLIQGDWRYFQCSCRCHDQIYPNKEQSEKMYVSIEDTKVPTELIPKCPKCGQHMEPWVRSFVFLEGNFYKKEMNKYYDFLMQNRDKKVLFLELGVGNMTPMFIKEPFWKMTYTWPDAYYISINPKDAMVPRELSEKGLSVNEDIAKVLHDAITEKKNVRN